MTRAYFVCNENNLALETSAMKPASRLCADATATRSSCFSEVASQIAEHEKYGGIVPEIASRNHLGTAPTSRTGDT
jgi:N6-L-threonylcarbamoyladenine synthase